MIIKNGKLIGKFNQVYQDFDDSRDQQKINNNFDSRLELIISWCLKLKKSNNANKVIDLGCSFGILTEKLRKLGFISKGFDSSSTAIEKAKV